MNVRRGGLGRGLGALIPTGPALAESAVGHDLRVVHDPSAARTPAVALLDLPPEVIEVNPRQPRQAFDEVALDELVASIREVGVLQPVVVRPLGAGRYQLVMGERRWRAAQRAGLAAVPAIVRDTEDAAMLRDALLENLHRQQLNPLEEAAAYQQLLEEFGATHDELAQRIGRSRPQISNTLRLLQLPPAVQRRVAAGVLSAGHARALLGLAEAEAQEHLAQRIVAEGLSVRAVEELVALGGDPEHKAGRRSGPLTRRPQAPGLTAVADRLAEALETRVKVELGRSRGKIVVEFATLDDLERIVAAIDPTAAPGGSASEAAATVDATVGVTAVPAAAERPEAGSGES